MKERCGLAVSLQPLGKETDGVVAFGMHHHQCAVLARNVQHLKDLPVGELHVVVGHEDLHRGVALGDQRRQSPGPAPAVSGR